MATLFAPGIGSGLDVNSIVNQLLAIERRPLDALETRESQLQAQLSAFGQFKSALSTFQSAMSDLSSLSKFKIFSGTSSNESAFTATTASNAAGGEYAVNVTALAQNNKLASGAFTSSTDVVGTGTLTVAVGTASFAVTIDGTNNTLDGIRTAINEASGNTGVTATIVNSDIGSSLVFTSDAGGVSNALTVTVAGDGDGNDTDNAGLSQLTYVSGGTENLSQIQAAQDATLTVDGFAITSATNSVSGAIEGLTFELKGVGSGTLTLARDDTAIEASVQEFADAYNALRGTIDTLRIGSLEADSTLRSIERSLQSVVNAPASVAGGVYSYLSEIGITTNEAGDFTLDSTELKTALDSDFNSVAQLFANNPQGFAFRFDALAGDLLAIDGLIDAREDGINARISDIQDRQVEMLRRLELSEGRLRAQFTALDTLMGQLQSTSNFLTQQLAILNPNRKK